MRIRVYALGLLTIASLSAQKQRFSWQEYCFNHPSAVTCPGHEYAVKPTKPDPAGKSSRDITRNPFAKDVHSTPEMTVLGGIDWRFADPFADAVVGINMTNLAAAPLARTLIAQLGAGQGLTEADAQKILDRLSIVDEIGISVRGGRIVAMLTGRVADTLPPLEAGMKALPVGSALLIGHPDAVDQAASRINFHSQLSDLAQLAEVRQAGSEFWAIVSAQMIGPQVSSLGIKRFSLIVSLRDQLTTDVAFEFGSAPPANALKALRVGGAESVEGNAVHFRMAMDADELHKKFGQIATGPLGQKLSTLLAAAHYLPGRDTSAPVQNKPVIYGLDDGPRVVK